MAQFQLKQPVVIVDAGQWFHDADTEADPVAANPDGSGTLYTHVGQLAVHDGDWIIRYADGTLDAKNPADFEAAFMPRPAPDELAKLVSDGEKRVNKGRTLPPSAGDK